MYLDLTLKVSTAGAEDVVAATQGSGLNVDLAPQGVGYARVRLHGNPAEDFDLALALAQIPHQEIDRTEIP